MTARNVPMYDVRGVDGRVLYSITQEQAELTVWALDHKTTVNAGTYSVWSEGDSVYINLGEGGAEVPRHEIAGLRVFSRVTASDMCDAEIERLRAALVHVSNHAVEDPASFARRVLNGYTIADAIDPTAYLATLTCHGCGARDTCEYVDDGYNTNGDCLAEK